MFLNSVEEGDDGGKCKEYYDDFWIFGEGEEASINDDSSGSGQGSGDSRKLNFLSPIFLEV